MTVETNWKICSEKLEHRLERSKGFILNVNDVLCGRGKTSYQHAGNRRFRHLIISSLEDYNNAVSRNEKSLVVKCIVQEIKSTGGRFLKQDKSTGKWTEHSDKRATEKVGHAIRDAISLIVCKEKKRKHKKELATSPSGQSLPHQDVCFHERHYEKPLFVSREISCSAIEEQISLPALYKDNKGNRDQLLFGNDFIDNDDECDFLTKIDDALGPLPKDGEIQDPIGMLLAK